MIFGGRCPLVPFHSSLECVRIRCCFRRRVRGAKGDLQIESARVCVKIHDFACKIEVRAFLGAHGLRLDLLDGNAAACHDGFTDRSEARYRNGEIFEKLADSVAFFGCDGVNLFVRGNGAKLDERLAQLGGEKLIESIDEVAVFIFFKVGKKSLIERLRVKRRF